MSNEQNSLRTAVTAALSLANEDPSLLVAVNNIVNRAEWEVLTGDDVMSIDWVVEAGEDLDEVVDTISRARDL